MDVLATCDYKFPILPSRCHNASSSCAAQDGYGSHHVDTAERVLWKHGHDYLKRNDGTYSYMIERFA